MEIKLGDKQYQISDLKDKLIDLKSKIGKEEEGEIYEFSILGGRKICLGQREDDTEKFQYNEILTAILKAIQDEFEKNKKKPR